MQPDDSNPICPRCNKAMAPQPRMLDLSWAGDGPNAADTEFHGIFARVHRCQQCGAQSIRTVQIEFESPRLTAAT
jgi:hypothetical protein